MKSFILLLAFVAACLSANGQSQFKGKIISSENGTPIPNATIQFNSDGIISNQSGEFVLTNPSYPAVLKISHLNFHPKTIVISSQQESGISIRMIPKTTRIDEIEVVGERIKRFFPKKYYYIVDYFLLGDKILTIGYKNSNLSQGQLTLIDQNQDTLANMPITKPKQFFQDGFGNVHLFAGDSVYQVFVQNKQVNLLYPGLASEFAGDLLKFQFHIGNNFVFKQISGHGQANEYYVIDTLAQEKIELQTIYQEELFSASEAAVRYRPWKPRLSGKGGEDPGAANDMFEAYVFDLFVTHKPITSQVFKYNEGIVIFDFTNNASLIYSSKFEKIDKIKNNFPKHHQRQKRVIRDPVTNKFYWVYYKGSRVLLGEIDIGSGLVIDILETPSLPFIENVQIRDEVIWFLYQPRLGETVRSLYRKI